MKVLCIGESSYDIFVSVPSFPLENSKNKYSERVECGGGLINNIAYLLGKWDVENYLATAVGNDEYATKIKKELETAGTKIDYIETHYDKPTNLTMYLNNTQNGSATSFNLNNSMVLKKYTFAVDPDIVVADGTDYTATLTSFEKYTSAIKILVVNEVTKENTDLSKYSNYIIYSKNAAELITNSSIDYNNSATLSYLYNSLKQRYSKAEIIINISGYGTLYQVNNEIKIMPALSNLQRIDYSGEMDAFVGSFIYCLTNNYEIEKAITYAVIASSLSTTKLTARQSIPTQSEVINYYNTKFGIASPEVNVNNNMPTNPVNQANQVNNTGTVNEQQAVENVVPNDTQTNA